MLWGLKYANVHFIVVKYIRFSWARCHVYALSEIHVVMCMHLDSELHVVMCMHVESEIHVVMCMHLVKYTLSCVCT